MVYEHENYTQICQETVCPAEGAAEDVMNVWATHSEDHEIVKCGLLYGLGPKLQKHFEHHGVHQMINDLKAMFQTPSQGGEV